MEINQITGDVLDAALKIHKLFGPGLFESVYERLLLIELEKRGHIVRRQVSVSFAYEGNLFKDAFRIDLLIDDEVIVELKSTAAMSPVFPKQLRTYLVLTGKEIGLLINFGMTMLKDGFVRVINSHKPDVRSGVKNASKAVCDLDLTSLRLCDSAGDVSPVSLDLKGER